MSNLLKKASIITTPTAYDDGRILSVKPNENLYGSELVTNGDFATNSDWIVGGSWTISGGSANCDGGTSNLDQTSLATNTKYKVTITVSNITTGTLAVRLGGSNADVLSLTENGTYTGYGLSNSAVFRLRSQSGFDGSVDNVSVVEDLSGDFNFERGSAATRVNAQGLVENVQILSSELVQNGNFSEIGSEEVSNGDFSQEGSEQVVNGDFATDSDWSANGWVISNGQASNSLSGAGHNLFQGNVTSVGETFKVVINATISAGSVVVMLGGGTGGYNVIGEATTSGTFTYYGVSNGTDNRILLQTGSGTTVGSVSIDNVSVKEVGQDWTLSSTFSIEENKLNCVSDGSYQFAYQNNVFTVGKTYKVTFDILDYVSGNIRVRPGGGAITSISANGSYTLYYTIASGGTQLFVERNSACDMSITNISVKEVGQDWNIKSGEIVSVDSSGLVFDNSTGNNSGGVFQNLGLSDTKKYRMTATMQLLTGSSNGTFTVFSSTSTGSGQSGIYYGSVLVVGGDAVTETFDFSPASGDVSIQLACDEANATYKVSNISVVEITDDTDLPRINYEGFSYQDVLGSEEVVNGDFATDSNWTKGTGWSIANGKATVTNSITDSIYQDILDLNKKYKVTFEITEITSGSLRIGIGLNFGDYFTQVGTYTYSGVPSTDTLLRINPSSGTNASIDNVSVKEITGQEVVPNSGCGSWLFEPQSTNLVTYSEGLNNWQKSGTNIITSDATSPSGQSNAKKIITNNVTNQAYSNTTVTVTQGATYTFSCFAKKGEVRFICLVGLNPVTFSYFDLELGVKGTSTVTSKMEDYGNGWYRCSTTFTADTTSKFCGIYLTPADDSLSASSIPNGDGNYIWGVQLEALSYPTSYIPTSGATSTRNQDIANNSGNSTLINSTEGVLYAEISALDNPVSQETAISISQGQTGVNRLLVRMKTNGAIGTVLRVANNTEASIDSNALDQLIAHKVAVKYKVNDIALWIDGIEIGTDNSANVFSANTLNEMSFNQGNNSNFFFGKTKALAVWKEALTDTELELLTAPAPEFPTFTLDFDTIAEQFTFTRGSEATFVNEQGLIESTNQIGPELVTNGDFEDGSTGWSLAGSNISIANGKGISTGSNFGAQFKQTILQTNKNYKLTFDIVDYTSGTIGLTANYYGQQNVFSSIGTHTAIFTSLNQTELRIYSENFIGSIDNVSVKEVISATNTPRIDYSTGVEAFLLEPQSTNLLTYSEDFSQWSNARTNDTANQANSPNGLNNGTLLEQQSGQTNAGSIFLSGLSLPSGTYTQSIFAKKKDKDFIVCYSANAERTYFNLSNGTIGTVAAGNVAKIEDYGNGWYRCAITYTTTTTGSVIAFYLADTDNSTTVTDSGGVYIYGAMLEQQSYPTSYIPTDGASATRNQETCKDATPTINSEEGVLYAEISALADDGTYRMISVSDGTVNNSINLQFSGISNQIRTRVENGGIPQADITFTVPNQTSFNKIAILYKSNNFELWSNGFKVGEDTSGTPPSGINKLSFDRGDNGSPFFGNTKGLQVFDKALSDYQLKQLTTI